MLSMLKESDIYCIQLKMKEEDGNGNSSSDSNIEKFKTRLKTFFFKAYDSFNWTFL